MRAARARLHELEQQSVGAGETPDLFRPRAPAPRSDAGAALPAVASPADEPVPPALLDALRAIDADRLSPREALDLAYRLAELAAPLRR